jgi:hypothetical protein
MPGTQSPRRAQFSNRPHKPAVRSAEPPRSFGDRPDTGLDRAGRLAIGRKLLVGEMEERSKNAARWMVRRGARLLTARRGRAVSNACCASRVAPVLPRHLLRAGVRLYPGSAVREHQGAARWALHAPQDALPPHSKSVCDLLLHWVECQVSTHRCVCRALCNRVLVPQLWSACAARKTGSPGALGVPLKCTTWSAP